jgi:hypothetical protein
VKHECHHPFLCLFDWKFLVSGDAFQLFSVPHAFSFVPPIGSSCCIVIIAVDECAVVGEQKIAAFFSFSVLSISVSVSAKNMNHKKLMFD